MMQTIYDRLVVLLNDINRFCLQFIKLSLVVIFLAVINTFFLGLEKDGAALFASYAVHGMTILYVLLYFIILTLSIFPNIIVNRSGQRIANYDYSRAKDSKLSNSEENTSFGNSSEKHV